MNIFFENNFVGRVTNIAILLVSMLLLIFNVAKVDTNQPQIDLSDYNLVFNEEFEGSELNRYVWRNHNEEGVRKGGYWTLDQVSVSDGNLHIKTEYKEDGKFGAGWYTGAISTEGLWEQKYGYFETRCILPKGAGLWSAFWLMTPSVANVDSSGRDGTEIDVFESPYYAFPNNNKVTLNLHYDGYSVNSKYKNVKIVSLDNDPYENYNTYGVLWTEDSYTFYVNGYKVAETSYGGVSQVPEYPILSCEVDGVNGTPTFGWSKIITENGNDFTADFVVDYVHIYQAK